MTALMNLLRPRILELWVLLFSTVSESIFEEVQMQSLLVPPWSRGVGRTLTELALARTFGVQVAGIHRGGLRILNPRAEEKIAGGDELLALGTPGQIREFKTWLNERPEETSAAQERRA